MQCFGSAAVQVSEIKLLFRERLSQEAFLPYEPKFHPAQSLNQHVLALLVFSIKEDFSLSKQHTKLWVMSRQNLAKNKGRKEERESAGINKKQKTLLVFQ